MERPAWSVSQRMTRGQHSRDKLRCNAQAKGPNTIKPATIMLLPQSAFGVVALSLDVAGPPLSRRLFRQQVCESLFPLFGRLCHALKKDWRALYWNSWRSEPCFVLLRARAIRLVSAQNKRLRQIQSQPRLGRKGPPPAEIRHPKTPSNVIRSL